MDAVDRRRRARRSGDQPSCLAARAVGRRPCAALGTRSAHVLARRPADRDAIAFLEHTETALPADAVVFADMCVAGLLARRATSASRRRRGLHYPMGWGTLGFALPAAIGAVGRARPTGGRVRRRRRHALRARRAVGRSPQHGTPCTIVVVDDGGYGMLRFGPTATAAQRPAARRLRAGRRRRSASRRRRVDGVGDDYAKALAEAVESGAAEPAARAGATPSARHDHAVLADQGRGHMSTTPLPTRSDDLAHRPGAAAADRGAGPAARARSSRATVR